MDPDVNPYATINATTNDTNNGTTNKQQVIHRTVRNRTAAPVQITAEQILRETQQYQEHKIHRPTQFIQSAAELDDYRRSKREGYENRIRQNKHAIGVWTQYAKFEAQQFMYDRARSVYERALQLNYTNWSLWVAYATMEMHGKFVNHARNVWDRAVTLLPRVDVLWYKYTYMEEILKNIDGCRAVYERWMAFEPDLRAWTSYIKFEVRQAQFLRARTLFERLTLQPEHHNIETYLKWAQFEQRYGSTAKARHVYERALIELIDESQNTQLILAFADFETQHGEYERTRTIYQYALDHLPKDTAKSVFEQYTTFEKQYGTIEHIEQTVLAKRRFEYEEQIQSNPYQYDVWYDYLRLQQSSRTVTQEAIVALYERAITYQPPVAEKYHYKRYIYLWISYALYAEVDLNDAALARTIYDRALKLLSQMPFTFAKLYIMAAQCELRQQHLDRCRQLLGTAIGRCFNKQKVFAAYIDIELQLGNIDRCRQLYERQLELLPHMVSVWLAYSELEQTLEEHDRVRALYKLATSKAINSAMDTPAAVWSAYTQFEEHQQQYDAVRHIYQQQLQQLKGEQQPLQTYLQYAEFEVRANAVSNARQVYTDGDAYYRKLQTQPTARLQLLEQWKLFEQQHGMAEQQQVVEQKMPTEVIKRREILAADGETVEGYEEYSELLYADEQSAAASTASGTAKLLEMARKWKAEQALKQQQQQSEDVALEDEQNDEEIVIDES